MNIILLGPQGSGKGTQAELMVARFHLSHFEVGKILRSIAASDNPKSASIKDSLNSGKLVPDELVRLIAWDFINKHDKNQGFIFDGYPRSVAQYFHLKDMLMKFGKKVDAVIDITIPESETIRRLASRRTCPKCGNVYNLLTNPPPAADTCGCGGKLVQREDDQPEAIKKRLQIYYETTHQVFLEAQRDGIAHEIDGNRPIAEISADITQLLKNLSS